MEYAEKMYLVPSQQLEQLKGPTPKENIRSAAISSLDTEMQGILNRSDLTEYEKAKRYDSLLQKYLTHIRQKETEKEKLSLFLPQTPQNTEEAPVVSDNVYQEVLDNLPARYKNHARLLLNKMKQNKDVSAWDVKGTFVYKGDAISGTNMMDLVKGVTQTHALTTKRLPKGWDVFMRALAELNVPTSVVGNPANREALDALKSPKGITTTTPVHSPILSHRSAKKQRQRGPTAWLKL